MKKETLKLASEELSKLFPKLEKQPVYSIGFTRLMSLSNAKRNKFLKNLMDKMFLEFGSIDTVEVNNKAKTQLAFMSETEFKQFKKSI